MRLLMHVVIKGAGSAQVMCDHHDESGSRVQVAMQQSATDPDTGAIDMDIIQTGVSASRRRDREALANELAEHLVFLNSSAS